MKRVLWTFGLLVLAFSISGSTISAWAEDDAVAKTFATDPEASNLYIYRKPSFWAVRFPFQVFVDDNPIGEIFRKQYRALKVPPGQHVINVFVEDIQESVTVESLTIKTTAGENYYVKVTTKIGWSATHIKLKGVPEKKAQRDILKLTLAETFEPGTEEEDIDDDEDPENQAN